MVEPYLDELGFRVFSCVGLGLNRNVDMKLGLGMGLGLYS
jgi:hypothetical protein